MTSSILTNYASNRLALIKAELDRLTNAVGYSAMLGASQEHIDRLNEKRRYYQKILIQSEREEWK